MYMFLFLIETLLIIKSYFYSSNFFVEVWKLLESLIVIKEKRKIFYMKGMGLQLITYFCQLFDLQIALNL